MTILKSPLTHDEHRIQNPENFHQTKRCVHTENCRRLLNKSRTHFKVIYCKMQCAVLALLHKEINVQTDLHTKYEQSSLSLLCNMIIH